MFLGEKAMNYQKISFDKDVNERFDESIVFWKEIW